MLTALVIGARVLLAGVFAVAAVAKLVDREGTKEAVVAFGAPARLAGALAITVPFAELAVAGLLLPASTAALGAFGAVLLLALFSAAIAITLARGETPDCHCFGQLHSTPASRMTLARNGGLLALAILALGGSLASEPRSAVAWIGSLEGAELVALVIGATATAVIAVGAAAFLSLLRSYGRVLTRLDRVEAALARAGHLRRRRARAARDRPRAGHSDAVLRRDSSRRRGDLSADACRLADPDAPCLHEPALRALRGAHADRRRMAAAAPRSALGGRRELGLARGGSRGGAALRARARAPRR